MNVEQISVFIENKSGRLAEITSILDEAGINIRALSLADTSDFGILRLIVNDREKAKSILKERGFTVNKTEVVAVEVPDRPGGLARRGRRWRRCRGGGGGRFWRFGHLRREERGLPREHPERIRDPRVREQIKDIAQMEGAIIIQRDGVADGTFTCGPSLGAFHETGILKSQSRPFGSRFKQSKLVARPFAFAPFGTYIQKTDRLSAGIPACRRPRSGDDRTSARSGNR